MDFPWNALIAAGAAVIGALIPTVATFLTAERSRRTGAIERWNEKFWDRRMAAYQDFFAAVEALGNSAELMVVDAGENGGRLAEAQYEKYTKRIDAQLEAIISACSRGRLLFERGFMDEVDRQFETLTKIAILPPGHPDHHKSLKSAAEDYGRMLKALEPIAREHLNPGH
ncbi:hypothetical protein, partial [Bosea sp. TAB14]|uniref:hypothetical protein n=1 Tax=Bosea sp. TAB14 TaxID=3237481 RepID=UPI003F93D27F